MSFPRYESYKDSGIEWLGEVPEHWECLAVWLLFELGRGRVISHEEILDNTGDFPVYSSQTDNNGEMGRLNTFDFDGDYLTWTTDGANAGTVFRRSGKFNCTNVCGTLKPRNEQIVLDYCVHALSISTASFVRQDINPKLMNNVMAKIRILFPPHVEQFIIAAFLNRETAKIDALIAEQQRLIELLKEKRQAVISHAVTKGLNPDAPMKDSGIEWLGEVPEHWVDLPLKAVASHNDDVLDEHTEDDYEILYVDISSVDAISGISSKESMPFSSAPSRARRRVKHGDVIVSTVRTYLRAIARIYEPEDNLIVSTGFCVVRPSECIFYGFLGYLLSSNFFVDAVISHSVGVSYPAINASDLVGIKVSLPPILEQQTIVAFLDRETAKLDALTAEAQTAILLLQERRTALISAAVTGKIDVRGLVGTQPEREAAA